MSEDKKLKAENEYTAGELYLDAVRINKGLGVHSDRLVDELLFACDRIAELEKEPLREVGIPEVCEWMVKTYPLDVFTGESGDEGAILIAALRDKAAEILKFRKEADDAEREADK